jgi:hypothetical protein
MVDFCAFGAVLMCSFALWGALVNSLIERSVFFLLGAAATLFVKQGAVHGKEGCRCQQAH